MDATADVPHGATVVHHEETARKLRIGMFLYVLVDVTFVGALFAAYIFLRLNNTQGLWFPPGVRTPPFGPSTVFMIILVVSGILYAVGQRTIAADNQSVFRLVMPVAQILMIIALVGEIWYMGHLPFTTTDGAFASSFIMLSAYHVFHLLAAALIGLGFVNRVLHGRYTSANTIGIRAIGYYWYWTVIYGVALWLLVIVQPPTV